MSRRGGISSKTESNVVTDLPLPGVFRKLVGAEARAWHSLPPNAGYEFGYGENGDPHFARVWAEALSPESAEVLAEWKGGAFAGMAALTRARRGKGSAYYWGWHPSPAQAVAALALLADQAGVRRLKRPLSLGVLLVRRGTHRLWFNFTDHAQTVEAEGDVVIVPPRDVAVR